jgi:hypothetical protein
VIREFLPKAFEPTTGTLMSSDEGVLESLLWSGHSFDLTWPREVEWASTVRVSRNCTNRDLIQKEPCLGLLYRYYTKPLCGHPGLSDRLGYLSVSRLSIYAVSVPVDKDQVRIWLKEYCRAQLCCNCSPNVLWKACKIRRRARRLARARVNTERLEMGNQPLIGTSFTD